MPQILSLYSILAQTSLVDYLALMSSLFAIVIAIAAYSRDDHKQTPIFKITCPRFRVNSHDTNMRKLSDPVISYTGGGTSEKNLPLDVSTLNGDVATNLLITYRTNIHVLLKKLKFVITPDGSENKFQVSVSDTEIIVMDQSGENLYRIPVSPYQQELEDFEALSSKSITIPSDLFKQIYLFCFATLSPENSEIYRDLMGQLFIDIEIKFKNVYKDKQTQTLQARMRPAKSEYFVIEIKEKSRTKLGRIHYLFHF